MNFDLNIENYSRDELIQMFELPIDFDRNIFDMKETKLRDNIMTNTEINKETMTKTLNFIVKAKNIILNSKSYPTTVDIEMITNLINDNFKILHIYPKYHIVLLSSPNHVRNTWQYLNIFLFYKNRRPLIRQCHHLWNFLCRMIWHKNPDYIF